MKRKDGFTIVEIAVVIAIISILAVLTITAYNRVQVNARNDATKSKATVISEALEKYYEKNGQYPPDCAALTGAVGTVASSYFQGIDSNTLTRNGNATGTNSLVCSGEPSTTNFSYDGSTDQYNLSYLEESTGKIVTFNSRHRPPSNAPAKPLITLAYNSSTGKIVATASTSPCATGNTLYSFRSQTNTDAWTAYTTPSFTSTTELTPLAGYKYAYQAQVQCSGNALTAESNVSNSYTHPVYIVGNPSISSSRSADQSTATMISISCPASTTPKNRIQSRTRAKTSVTSFDAWGSYSTTNITNTRWIEQGWQNTFRGEAFCDGVFADSSTVSTGETSVVRPINTPPTPTWSGASYFRSGINKSYPADADFTSSCTPGAWRVSATFDSYPEWNTSEHWFHNFPYDDWWYSGRSTTQYVKYYARYTCKTDFASAKSAEGYSRREVRP